MVTLRAFLILLAGYLAIVAVSVFAAVLIARLVPAWRGESANRGAGYLFVNLGYSFLAAAAGGYMTAWLAGANPVAPALMLAIIVLVLGAINAFMAKGKHAIGHQVALTALSPIGVLAGALVRLRVLGVL